MNTNDRTPVTIVTGCLGAGKTTLLNHLLADGPRGRVGIIENEFGDLAIDRSLLVNAQDEIVEVNTGRICCTARGDLVRSLVDLHEKRASLDRVVVETTGLVEPGPVVQPFFTDGEISRRYMLDGIVTVVDCLHASGDLIDNRQAREQIAFANVVVLNKTDLVSELDIERLAQRVRGINGAARIIRSVKANVPARSLYDLGGIDLERHLRRQPTLLAPVYPFEYLGVHELAPGRHSLLSHDGRTPSLSVVLLSVASPEAAAEESADLAARLFSSRRREAAPGGLVEVGSHLALDLGNSGEKRFPFDVDRPGSFALYAERLPEETCLRIVDESGAVVIPSWERRLVEPHTHDDDIVATGISAEGFADREKVGRWLEHRLCATGSPILRSKGILNVFGEERRFVVQGVGQRVDADPGRPWGDDRRINQLTIIGRNLDREGLTAEFRACLSR